MTQWLKKSDREDNRLVCPYCDEVMVKGRIKMADGTWRRCWLCGCVVDDEETETLTEDP